MKTLLLIFSLLSTLSLLGQETKGVKEICGKVLNSRNKAPISGAVISASSQKTTTTTDVEGVFRISIAEEDNTLWVQYADFYPVEYVFRENQEVIIYLLPLDIAGYGSVVKLPFFSQKIEDKTGTSQFIFTKDQNRGAYYSDEMLSGTISGVRALQKGGMPGEGNYVNFRGIRTLYGYNNPVFLVDGMPIIPNVRPSAIYKEYSRNIFDFMSVKELEQLLMASGYDAAALGAISPHGVVVMTTEHATDMDTRVEFETVNGVSFLPRKLPVLDGEEFKEYLSSIGQSILSSDMMNDNFPFLYGDATLGEKYWAYQHNTDWQRKIFSPAFTTENVLKVKGGDNIAKYAIVAGYAQQNGIEDNTSLNRYFARFNGDMVMHKRVDMFTHVGFNHYDNTIFEQGLVPEVNPMLAALLKPSILSPNKVSNTGKSMNTWDNYRQFGVSNPAYLVEHLNSTNMIYDIMINLGMTYKFSPTLNLRALFGIHYDYNREKSFVPGRSVATVVPRILSNGTTVFNSISVGVTESMSYYGNISLDYVKKWRQDHHLDVKAAAQLLFKDESFELGRGYNTPTDYNQSLSNVTSSVNKYLDGYENSWRWGNGFLRLDYNYRQQLYAGVNVAMESSSISGEEAPLFQFSPSINLAWKMHRAPFLRQIEWISDLTLRTEWSRTGNVLMPMKLGDYTYESAFFKELGGIVRANVPNPDLTPEWVNTFNIGVNFSTLGRKVNVNLDYYHSTTTDLVLPANLSSAFGSKPHYFNGGKLQNTGLGIALQATLLTRGYFQWDIGFNLSSDRSKVKSLGGYQEIITTLSDGAEVITRKGESPYLFYGYKTNGVYTTTAEAKSAGLKDFNGYEFQGGDMRFVNISDEDQIINAKDKTIIGDPTPDFYGGFFTAFKYRQFSLKAHFTYSSGNDVYNGLRAQLEKMTNFQSQTKAVKSRWTYEGQETTIPRASLIGDAGNDRFSDRWIEDGSFLKLKNLTVDYQHMGKLWIFNSFQAYLSADNLFVLTRYLGYDPEFSNSYQQQYMGVDYAKVPAARTFKVGLRFGL